MYKIYSYSRIALISLIVIITIIATVYCYEIENTSNEELVTEKIEVTEVVETTEPEDVVIASEYERLYHELNKALESKNFNYEVNLFFKDTFERVYDNFDSWTKGYRDFPTREEFIMKSIINPIYSITDVVFYESGSEEAERLINEEYMPSGWVERDGEELIINIIADKAENADSYARAYDVEMFFHEVTHCKDKALINDYCIGYEELDYFFTEGMATFNQKFVYDSAEDEGGAWTISDSKETYTIKYTKNNCIGYLLYMNFCEKLAYLADYKNVERVELGEIAFSDLVDIIADRYGREKTDKFFAIMIEMFESYEESWRSDEVFNLAVEAEMIFLDFIRYDIEKIDNAEAAKDYKPIYDFYINKNLPDVEYKNSYININREFFKIEVLDEMLNEKLALNNIYSEN